MIYEFGRCITRWCKEIGHYFKAMFCKSVRYESHGVRVCKEQPWVMGKIKGYSKCRYWDCPKAKGIKDAQ